VVESTSLLTRQGLTPLEGSNPSVSAKISNESPSGYILAGCRVLTAPQQLKPSEKTAETSMHGGIREGFEDLVSADPSIPMRWSGPQGVLLL
jgi:hypothetical protein